MWALIGSWVLGKAKTYGLYILLAVAVLGVILAVLAKTKSLGRAEERVDALERTIEAIKRRKEVQREIREDLRRSGDTAADRLRRDWQRD